MDDSKLGGTHWTCFYLKDKNLITLILTKTLNEFSSASGKTSNTLDTSSFSHKSHLRTNYRVNKFEEDYDMKNQFEIKNLPNFFPPKKLHQKFLLIVSLTIQV